MNQQRQVLYGINIVQSHCVQPNRTLTARARVRPALLRMRRVRLEEEKDGDCRDKENERQQKSADHELSSTLLFRARAGDAESRDERFRQPGEELHGVVRIQPKPSPGAPRQ